MLTRSWGKALLFAAMILAALLATAAVLQVARAAETDPQTAQMQEHMRLMQSQMEQMASTRDPKERQRLYEEHWATMQKMMGTMQCSPKMMGQMAQHRHGMMMQPPSTPPPPPAKK